MTIRGCMLVLAVAAGCGSAPPSAELLSARAEYKEANTGPAAEWSPDKLLEAKQALDAAEAAYKEDGNTASARSLAYIAQRRALLAESSAGAAAAAKDVEAFEGEYKDLLERSLKTSRDGIGSRDRELSEKRSALKDKDAELGKERAARSDAEQRLRAAMKSLEEIAKVKEDARGTVITLSGSVLFKTGQSALLPIAETQLKKVAEALNEYDQGRKIVVAGHTDATGSATKNRRLSLARAESVRAFLVESGVAAERVTAVGKGKAEPVADNKTPDGRANNRRVEIIVEPK